jgi:uncharacterized protein (TIGR03083 family)
VEAIERIVEELRFAHDSLLSLVHGLDGAELERASYATEWTVAQVLSHLGSGAEINLSNLQAALRGGEPIPQRDYPELWSRWDNLPPSEQAAEFERWHGALVASFEDAGPQLGDLRVSTAMGTLSGAAVLGMRFRELVIHSWDVAVAFDDGAVIRRTAAGILADQTPEMMGRLADQGAAAASDLAVVSIAGFEPERSFVLSMEGEAVTLREDAEVSGTPLLRLPTEAFVRLLYGRLDDNHINGTIVQKPDGLLNRLRTVFHGF